MVKAPAIMILAAGLSLGGINIPQAWYWWKGNDTYFNGEYDKAVEAYGEALATDAEYGKSQVAMNQGDALYRQEKYAEAESAFTHAFEADETNWSALHNQGNARFFQQDLQGALESYEQALAIHEDEDTRYNYEYVKKLLEEQKKEEEQNQDQQQQKKKEDQPKEDEEQGGEDEQESEDSQNDEGDQGEENDEQQDGENESESKNDEGEEQDEQNGGEEEKDQGGDQEQQSGQGGNQQNQNQGSQMPDYGYSQQRLDQLAKEEAYYQQYQAQQRSPDGGDAVGDLFEELFGQDGNMFWPGPADRRRDDDDGVDW